MATLEATLRLNDQVSDKLARMANNMNSFSKTAQGAFKGFKNDIDNGFSMIESRGRQTSSMFKSMLGANLMSKAISGTFNAIRGSMDGAIDRFDTLNNYPRLLENLGYSAEQAQTSTKKLADGIDGLPTRLDEVVSTSQRMVSFNKDIEKSTDATLALNNAFLASGASADKVSRGTEQYLKAMSTGKMGLDSFTTLQETMPLALDKVAEKMGFVGKTAQSDLYEALKTGSKSVEEFQDALIELGTSGGELEKLARTNSEGIKTSLTNLKNTAVKGTAEMMFGFDKAISNITGKNIAQHLDSFKGVINSTFSFLSSKIEPAMRMLQPFFTTVADGFAKIKEPVTSAFKGIAGSAFKTFSTSGVKAFQLATNAVAETIKTLANVADRHSGTIGKLIGNLPKIMLGVGAFKVGKGVTGWIGDTAKKINVLSNATKNFFAKFGKAKSTFSSFAKVGGDTASKKSLVPKLELGMFKGQIEFAANVANMLLVAKAIQEYAKAVQMIDEAIPDNIGGVSKKIALLGGVSAGFSALSFGIGKFTNLGANLSGALTLGSTAVAIRMMAKSLKAIDDNVPDSLGNFHKKMLNLESAILLFGSTSALIGAGMVATGGLGAIAQAGGFLAIASIAKNIRQMSEAIKTLDDLPDDFTGVEAKVKGIRKVIDSFKTGGLFSSVKGALVTGREAKMSEHIRQITEEFTEIAENLRQIGEIDIADVNTDKIARLKEMASELLSGDSYVGSLLSGKVGSAKRDSKVAQSIKEIAKDYTEIAESLAELNTVDIPEVATENISRIKEVSQSLLTGDSYMVSLASGKVGSANRDKKVAQNIKEIAKEYIEIAEALNELNDIELPEDFTSRIDTIKQVSAEFLTGDTYLQSLGSGKVGSANRDKKVAQDVKKIAREYIEIAESLAELSEIEAVDNIDSVKSKIDNITEIAQSFLSAEYTGEMKVDQAGKQNRIAEQIKETINQYKEIAESLNAISVEMADSTNIEESISNLTRTVEQLASFELPESAGVEGVARIVEMVEQYNQIAETLGNFSASFDGSAVLEQVEQLKQVIEQLANFDAGAGDMSGLSAMAEQLQEAMNSLTNFSAEIQSVTQSIQSSMQSMSASFQNVGSDIAGAFDQGIAAARNFASSVASSMAQAVASAQSTASQIVASFAGLSGQLQAVGMQAMAGLASGIRAGGAQAVAAAQAVAQQVAAAARSALDIHSPSRVFKKIGQFTMQGLTIGITSSGKNAIEEARGLSENLSNEFDEVEERANWTSRIGDIKRASDNSIHVTQQQVTPSVTVVVEGSDYAEDDIDRIVEAVEEKVIELVDVALV